MCPFHRKEERTFFPYGVLYIASCSPALMSCVADRISRRNKLTFFYSKPAAPRSAMTPCHSCATCQESKGRGSEYLVPSQEECENPTGPNYKHYYRALASNWVGLTPRRAFNKLKPKNTTAVTAKLNSLFHTGKRRKQSKLSVVHMQHAIVELLLFQLLCLCNMQRRRSKNIFIMLVNSLMNSPSPQK